MTKKMMLLALAAISATMFALPAVASAGEWEMHPENVAFTVEGPPGTLTASNGDTVTCESTSGNGSYAGKTSGTMSLVFHGCKSSGTACTTAGQPSGTVVASAAFTNVYLSKTKTTPGITITSTTGTSGNMAVFKCGFGLVTLEVSGSVNGHVESECNEATMASHKIEFASGANHGEVKWPFVTEDSTKTKDDLTVKRNGVSLTGSMDATGTVKYTGGVTAGVTCV